MPVSSFRSHLTLALTTILHAFTHAYGVLLVPLYLLMVSDLKLKGVEQASLIVTIFSLVYCLGSYGAGVLADRVNRKALLGIGLLGHAAAITCMGLTRQYEWLIALGVMAGLFGTLFHPAGTALAPAHYPKHAGLAIGILGSGAGLGFFAGPQYAGWRAQSATWRWDGMAGWQVPCVEMGLAGIVFATLFLLLAREARDAEPGRSHRGPPMGRALRWQVVSIAVVLAGRDLAGIALLTLLSVYLQRALGMGVKQAGFVIGIITLVAVVANPLAVWLTDGRRRLPGLSVMLLSAGILEAMVPRAPAAWLLPLLIAFEAVHLGAYAVSDSAILERVSPMVRGRVVGLFLTVAGPIASTGPWLMGFWTDRLTEPGNPLAYRWPFATLGALMAAAALSVPLIARLGPARGGAVSPAEEIDPATLETAG